MFASRLRLLWFACLFLVLSFGVSVSGDSCGTRGPAAAPLPLTSPKQNADGGHMSTEPYARSTVADDAPIAQSPWRVEFGDDPNSSDPLSAAASALLGTFTAAQQPFNGPHWLVSPEAASLGRYERRMKVVLPSTSQGVWGCSTLLNQTEDERDWIEGNILLVERRGPANCGFELKLKNAMAAKAAGVLVYDCEDCGGALVRMAYAREQTIPGMFILREDGVRIRDYLVARREAYIADPTAPSNYTAPLYVVLNGTHALDPTELAALRQVASQLTFEQSVLDSKTQLLPWSRLSDPSFDPCLDRIVGLWCERGHVQSIYMNFLAVSGKIHSDIGQLTQLTYLTMRENTESSDDASIITGLEGDLPDTLCNLRYLRSFEFGANALTSVPTCIGIDQPLQVFSIDRNQIGVWPTSLSSTRDTLVVLTASSNLFQTMPDGINTLIQLRSLNLGANPSLSWNVENLSFKGWEYLQELLLDNCALYGQLPSDAFDGCKRLSTLSLAKNDLSGTLPNMIDSGSTGTARWSLGNNRFSGGIPDSWADAAVQVLSLEHNQLSAPLDILSSMADITYLGLDYNLIALQEVHDEDVGALIVGLSGPKLVTLSLEHNLIVGEFYGGWLSALEALTTLTISYNQLTALPDDLWDSKITSLDVSHNSLSGSIPTNINLAPPYVSFLDFSGNPDLFIWPLPTWLQFKNPVEYLAVGDGTYECQQLESTTSEFKILVDATFTQYNGCKCGRGWFGVPPLCDVVPIQAAVYPYGVGVLSNETDLQHANPDFFPTIMAEYDVTLNTSAKAMCDSLIASTSVVTTDPNGPRHYSNDVTGWPSPFGDSWYGNNRLTVGLSTYWSIDLRSIRFDRITGEESSNHQPLAQARISTDEQKQPVRAITVRLHISPEAFKGVSNQILVYEGTQDSLGAVAATLSGLDWLKQSIDNSSFTASDAYQCRYSATLASLDSSRVVEVQVLSNAATVYFVSRDSDQNHFVATYSYASICPDGLELNDDSEDGSYGCRSPSSPTSNVVVVISIVGGILLLLLFGWLIRERYLRENRQQREHKKLSPSDEASECEAKLLKVREWGLKKELIVQAISLMVEFVLVIINWVSAITLITASGMTPSDSRLAVVYVSLTVLSTMVFCLITVSRAISITVVWSEIQAFRDGKPIGDKSYELGVLARKILQLQILSTALLFDAAPMLVLNFIRIGSDPGVRFLIQVFLGSFLMGTKLVRLMEITSLQQRQLELRIDLLLANEERKATRGKSTLDIELDREERTGSVIPAFLMAKSDDLEIEEPSKVQQQHQRHSNNDATQIDVELQELPSNTNDDSQREAL